MTEQKASPPREDPKTFPFLNLPAELRNQIYDNVVDTDGKHMVSQQTSTLLASNKQIRTEFESMLWNDANVRNSDCVIPGQLALKSRQIPAHVVRQLTRFRMLLKISEPNIDDGRDKIRIFFSCSPSEGTYRLWGSILARRLPNWLSDEIEKYHVWKTIRRVETWMADKLPGLAMHPETKVPGAMPYPGQFPHISTSHRRHGTTIVAYHFGPSQLPIRQKFLVCFMAEGHILLLKAKAAWAPIRAKVGHRTTKFLENLGVVLSFAALLELFALVIPGMKFFSFITLVAIPFMMNVAIECLPWATRSWILMKIRWVWPTLFVAFTATLAFSAKTWSWWYIPQLLMSATVAIS